MIRPAQPGDAEAIARIYNYYILNTVITFEEQPITAQDMAQRMLQITAENLPWLVAESAGGIAGYAYASRWKDRSAYLYSVESTVYLDAEARGMRYGSQL